MYKRQLYDSAGSRISMSLCGCLERVCASGFALPMFSCRYICAESTLIISTGRCFRRAIAKSVLPEAVGPIKKMAAGSFRVPITNKPSDHVGTVYLAPPQSTETRLGGHDYTDHFSQ